MADIKKVIRLFKNDSGTYKAFSDANFSGAGVRLRKSTEAGADSGEYTGNSSSSGAFSPIGNGFWEINIDSEDSGYYLVQTKTTAAPTYVDADGFAPIYVQIEPTVDKNDTQTIPGAKIFGGNCIVTGAWTVSGSIDVTGYLKLGSTTVTANATDINKLDITADGDVEANKAVVPDGSKNVDFGTGGLKATTLDTAGILKFSGNETITDNSNLSVTVTTSILDSNSQALANALPAGTDNQIKIIVLKDDGVAGNDAVITPNKLYGGSTITLNGVGDSVVLIYLTDGWFIIGQNGVTIA